jgi:hypothetical protein
MLERKVAESKNSDQAQSPTDLCPVAAAAITQGPVFDSHCNRKRPVTLRGLWLGREGCLAGHNQVRESGEHWDSGSPAAVVGHDTGHRGMGTGIGT